MDQPLVGLDATRGTGLPVPMGNASRETTRGFPVGSDHVISEGDIVVIHARHEIPDWRVREFCRHPIYFREVKYYLRGRQVAEPPFAMRYELAPWPADLHEESGRSFFYGESFVRNRDQAFQANRQDDRASRFLLPFYPVLGFCWSKFKVRVLAPLGFAPDSITSFSTMLTFSLIILDSIFFVFLGGGFLAQILSVVPGLRHAFNGWIGFMDLILMLVMLADCLVRYSQLLRSEEEPDGFLEWMFRWFKKPADREHDA